MNRHSDVNLDVDMIRSIWADSGNFNSSGLCSGRFASSLGKYSGSDCNSGFQTKSASRCPLGLQTSSSQQAHLNGNSHVCSGNRPPTRAQLGGYDCAFSGLANCSSRDSSPSPILGYSTNSSPSTPTHRSSITSLWETSSGYSSAPPSPVYSPGGSSMFFPEKSSSQDIRYGSPPYFGTSESREGSQEHQSADKDRLQTITKALTLLLLNRVNYGYNGARGLLEATSTRRASTGADMHADRDYLDILAHGDRWNRYGSRDHSAAALFASNPEKYEMALEKIEKEAKLRRSSACQTEYALSWNGDLPTRSHASPTYATKVFVGGLPYDVTQEALTEIFGRFGLISVQFPPRGRGHAYLVFENEKQVKSLLDACEKKTDKEPEQFFFMVDSIRRGKSRQAQVIPWATEDSDWLATSLPSSIASSCGSQLDDNLEQSTSKTDIITGSMKLNKNQTDLGASTGCKQNTVFVGALHGEITAEGLQKILSGLFGPVVHVGIDTDKTFYPNGSARVTFASRDSFYKAVLTEFVLVVTSRFSKTIQLDAYIEDGNCSMCGAPTPVFCRHPKCFCYYCPFDFEKHRRVSESYHPPVMRNRNSSYNGANLTKDRAHTI